ncbi:DUF4450 domain-containing protein [Parabacteroides sp. OttesenSCG-928-B22]|nr:DUF4450 domain-containing protein [Parabacteroides sp. OttesenSCG-928-B22]
MKDRMKMPLLWALFVCLAFSACQPKGDKETLRYWQGKERELRYHPEGEEFVITNGTKRFTRAIYGTNTGFRFETSDFPEFGLYMPRLGGSVYMAVTTPSETVWMKDLASIESRFKSGQRTYILRDSRVLGDGVLTVDAVALSDADGLVVRFKAENLPDDLKIVWIYGGANNQRFSREGDLGVDPEDSFFIKAENCQGNQYDMAGSQFTISYATSNRITGTFPTGSSLRLGDARQIDTLPELLRSEASEAPVVIAEYPLTSDPFYIELHNPKSHANFAYTDLEKAFHDGVAYRTQVSSTMKINTPDPFINTLGGIFSGAEDAVWEDPGYLHGAIGWRVPLTGWRAAYLADFLGIQDRARRHFNGYVNSQVTNVPVTLPHQQDQKLHLARAAKIWGTPMYSNGYICRTPNTTNVMHHYDMNLVFIDELLWHLNWTGDMAYAREVFPTLQRHLAWEKNAFDPDGDSLYDAVCCIWASDALQYNGGKVTHSSAYNYRSNKMMAEIAEKLGEDPTPYKVEAERILTAMNRELWIGEKGWWAEFVDVMGHRMRHDRAALWSVYHSIDSEVHDPFQAYQATRYVDTELPHIPVLGKGLADTDNYVVATTNWQPYDWSINNVAFAENAHTALSFWQAGRGDEAFKLFKGIILDAMYLGSGPGNITQVSFYDAARGELYRDFSDPVSMGVRAVVQGMYGIVPDLMNNRLVIRPGFPEAWEFADIKTKNMAYSFKRTGLRDEYTVEPNLLKQDVQLIMELNALTNSVKSVQVNGKEVAYSLIENAISCPKICFDAGTASKYDIRIEWEGEKISREPIAATVANGGRLALKLPFSSGDIYDPQGILTDGQLDNGLLSGMVSAEEGHRTLFVRVASGEMSYWIPVDVKVVKAADLVNNPDSEKLEFTLVNHSEETLSGDLYLNHQKTDKKVHIAANGKTSYTFDAPIASLGTNLVEVRSGEEILYTFHATNWNIPSSADRDYQTVDMQAGFNDRVRDIFAYDKYLTPRYEYTTLQVPSQGMGQWCHPERLSSIDDRGLRSIAAKNNNLFTMPQGIPFATPGGSDEPNVMFTTLWDNYPTEATLPLSGKASKAYLLMAASTYHMQCHVLNGQVRVCYKDGTGETLDLIFPDNLLPLDQDIFIDGWAFNCPQPRPWRVSLKSGAVSKYHAGELGVPMSNNPMYIDGGMATLLDLPLDPEKELESLTIETIANEVIIGVMGVTLMK